MVPSIGFVVLRTAPSSISSRHGLPVYGLILSIYGAISRNFFALSRAAFWFAATRLTSGTPAANCALIHSAYPSRFQLDTHIHLGMQRHISHGHVIPRSACHCRQS